ncbi:MAG: DNA repair protein RecN [Candidatus Competibacteraceae bacterium]|nr:DNA repair protein RecN [Candidatus Competibacteraceae bacterium]
MLTQINIHNFAIVDHLELELTPGMSALTGETGAGKSIIVDALALLLGDRGDNSVVRHGAERAEISAVFDVSAIPAARAWLASRDLGNEDDECHLRRVINRNGRSRAYISGTPQPLQLIKELGDYLVDIHGQHEHQSLLRRDAQRQLLDDYAGNAALLNDVTGQYQRWRELEQELTALRQADAQRDARMDQLRYQIDELKMLDLRVGEMAELEAEHRRLAHAGRLLETCQRAQDRLYDNEEVSVQLLLSQAQQELNALIPLDGQLDTPAELINAALIQVQEASDELRRYAQTLELDPQRLAGLEQRLADVHRLIRKHRVTEADELPELLQRLEKELDTLEHRDLHEEQLEKEQVQAFQAYSDSAAQLSQRRDATATELAEKISASMQGLGMPGGRFAITLESLIRPGPTGLESVEFLVSANPGQPLKPLQRVASGGELSRISLAIQVLAAHSVRIPTLIFDEVDSGIGGGIAEVVGRQLQTLGGNRQVLCVTHLPQVAAQAHRHLKVDKQTDGVETRTSINILQQTERIEELARMLGGLEMTEQTLAHAREMLEQASQESSISVAQKGSNDRTRNRNR